MPKDDYSVAKHYLSLAIDAESRGIDSEAVKHYQNAVRLFEKVIRFSTDSTVLCRSRKFCSNASERIAFIAGKSASVSNNALSTLQGAVTRILPSKETLVRTLKNVTSNAVDRVLNEIFEQCSVNFGDVAGNERAKQILNEVVILPVLRPELFTGLRAPVRGVLLFGPPGNGKTMIAKAVASESNCVFFNISAASIFSKWVGESENLVRALFAVARHVQPSIVFLDEVDCLLTARGSAKGHEVSRRVLTQLLVEMDGIGSSSERVLVLAATNRPQELDEAALRRFPRRVYIRMPDVDTRFCLLCKLLAKGTSHTLSTNDIRRIAANTEGYSASDLKELAKEAALESIRELNEVKLRTISSNEVRPVNLKDFANSLHRIRPSTSPESLTAYEQWNSKFGEPYQGTKGSGPSGLRNRIISSSMSLS